MKNKKKTVIILCIFGIIIVSLGIFYMHTNKNIINFRDNTLVKVDASMAEEGNSKIIENNIKMKMNTKVINEEKAIKELKGILKIENKSYSFNLKEVLSGSNIFSGTIFSNSNTLLIHFNLNTKAILISNIKENSFLFNDSDKIKSYNYNSILSNINSTLKKPVDKNM
ncbi:hypothetical protein [Clostridium sp.]|uniref:hypothetical protein n=1 Tax=Clostridium sp. TaxID=1506 RepID=UPI0039964943